jgi:hypothetical protein
MLVLCATAAGPRPQEDASASLNKELSKFTTKTAATFAPRASGAVKNPAVKGSALYQVGAVAHSSQQMHLARPTCFSLSPTPWLVLFNFLLRDRPGYVIWDTPDQQQQLQQGGKTGCLLAPLPMRTCIMLHPHQNTHPWRSCGHL